MQYLEGMKVPGEKNEVLENTLNYLGQVELTLTASKHSMDTY